MATQAGGGGGSATSKKTSQMSSGTYAPPRTPPKPKPGLVGDSRSGPRKVTVVNRTVGPSRAKAASVASKRAGIKRESMAMTPRTVAKRAPTGPLTAPKPPAPSRMVPKPPVGTAPQPKRR